MNDAERGALAGRLTESRARIRRDLEHAFRPRPVPLTIKLTPEEIAVLAEALTSEREPTRPPDGMCHATHWRRHLDEWGGELTVHPYDPERCKGGGPPWPVWIGTPPARDQGESGALEHEELRTIIQTAADRGHEASWSDNAASQILRRLRSPEPRPDESGHPCCGFLVGHAPSCPKEPRWVERMREGGYDVSEVEPGGRPPVNATVAPHGEGAEGLEARFTELLTETAGLADWREDDIRLLASKLARLACSAPTLDAEKEAE